jgi:hypothetical protein
MKFIIHLWEVAGLADQITADQHDAAVATALALPEPQDTTA